MIIPAVSKGGIVAGNERYLNVRASLFDRLVDDEPYQSSERVPLRATSREEMLESVRGEVMRLLNTRISVRDTAAARTVLNYGVHDYTAFYPANQENQRELAMMITQALVAFEPRLAGIRVNVYPSAEQQGLFIRIDAMLLGDTVSQPVSFPVVIRNRDAAIEVNPGE